MNSEEKRRSCHTSHDSLVLPVASLCLALLIQSRKSLGAFRNAAVQKHYNIILTPHTLLRYLTALHSGIVLTTWDNDPNKVHEKIVPPEVVGFWSAVCKTFVIVIKHACSIVEDVAVDLTDRH
jgi:hypothetical protein